MYAVGCTTPDVAVLIDAHAVAIPRLNLVKNITAGERRSVDIEDTNMGQGGGPLRLSPSAKR
jgi:hypothetical protein